MFKKIGLGALLLVCVGCSNGQNGTTGPSGSNGSNGSSGQSGYTALYQNNVSPSGSYSSELDARVSGEFHTTSEGVSPYLKLTVAPTIGQNAYSRVLVQFTNFDLPANATVLEAEVWMTLESVSSIAASVTIGAHSFSSTIYPTCEWNTGVYWNGPGTGGNWSICDSDSSSAQDGYFNATPSSVVIFPTTASGTNGVYRFILSPSDVQTGLTNGIVQCVLRSEGEFSGDSATSSIGFYPYTDTTGKAPSLHILYQ